MGSRFKMLSVLIILFPLFLSSQTIKNHPDIISALELIELWLDAQRDYEQIPGISAAIIHDQELIWSGGFGFTDLDKKNVTTSQTIYSICSISKLFTSIAIMQLRDAGKLSLDDPISKHLPWFNLKQKYPEGPDVTIRGLLTHSSGLPRESDYPYWTAPDFDFPSHQEIVERLSLQETLYPAETYFQYSNLGITLAGEIVAEVSGEKYEDYIRNNILNPLGVQDTRTYLPEEEKGKRLATGYSAMTRKGTRNKLSFFQANGIAPAAGFSSTVNDLGKFASWQFRLLSTGGSEILNVNTLREMQRVHWLDPDWKTTWGLGFSVWQRKEKTFVSHGGSCPGYRSHLVLEPKSKIAIVFMANASGIDISTYTAGMYDIIAPAITAALDTTTKAKKVEAGLTKYSGIYSMQPWGGEAAVLSWQGQLAMVYFPSKEPLENMDKLKHIAGNTFRRIRDDGELGEEIVFELDQKEKVIQLKQHSNYWPKVR